MKSKITPALAARFTRAIGAAAQTPAVIEAPAPELEGLGCCAYVAGTKASRLSKRFSDNDPLNLAPDDYKVFKALCRLRTSLRELGAGRIEAEVRLLHATVHDEGARCDFLAHNANDRKAKDVVELKLTGKPLPLCPSADALLQAAGYAELVNRNGKGNTRRIIVCYMSLADYRMVSVRSGAS